MPCYNRKAQEIFGTELLSCQVLYSPMGMAPLKHSIMHHRPVFLCLEISLVLTLF